MRVCPRGRRPAGAGHQRRFSADTEAETHAWGALAAAEVGAFHTAIAYAGYLQQVVATAGGATSYLVLDEPIFDDGLGCDYHPGVVTQQNQALRDLSEKRLASVVVASDAAQEFSEIHSNVYRLFTWLANMSEDKVKAAIGVEKGKIDKIVASLTAFRNQPHVTPQGRKLVDSMLPMLAKYRKLADDDVEYMADKLRGLRIFEDGEGRMSRSVEDVAGGVLVVPQFTLFGDVRRGRRPSFDGAAPPEQASLLYEQVVARLREKGLPVETGRFRAMMEVHAVVAGPVTIQIDSRKLY